MFRVKVAGVGYLFGRVIRVDLPSGAAPMPGADLLYIYSEVSADGVPSSTALDRNKLLIPPVFTNRLLWAHGYAETIDRPFLSETDVLENHYFWRFNLKTYVDDHGRQVADPPPPTGTWGLQSYQNVDDEVSRALGIRLASEGV